MRTPATLTIVALFRICDPHDHDDDDTGVDDTAVEDTGEDGDGAIIVSPDDLQGWENSRDDGGDGGPCAGQPRDGEGALCLSIPDPTDDLSPAYGWSISQDFGRLADLEAVSFDFWRDSTSGAYGHFTPAVVVYVQEPGEDDTTALIWEGAYNGYASYTDSVPEDVWVSDDLSDDHYWQWDDGVVEIYNRGLHDWGYSDEARVVKLGIQLGSGWNASWSGYADLLSVTFAGETTTWNFEP